MNQTDQIEGHMCEADVVCKSCNTSNGYWCYGNYQP